MPNINNLICKCSNCSKEFNLKNSNLRNETKKFGNDIIYIKILKCPLCKFESIVQIDDDVTMKLLRKQFSLNFEIGCETLNNRKPNKKKVSKLNRISLLLLQQRKMLNDKYNSVYCLQNGNKKISLNAPDVRISGNNKEEI